MRSSERVIELLEAGAEVLRSDELRDMNILRFPAAGEILIAGDLHHQRHHFDTIRSVANLNGNPDRHVILQELIHGGPLGSEGEDTSLEFLLDAIEWLLRYPGRVHLLLANHDLAQIHNTAITKDGFNLTERFNRHIQLRYGNRADEVTYMLQFFMLSQPIGAMSVGGIIMTHSLPNDSDMDTFDPTIFHRQLREEDYNRGGSVHQLVWGRNQSGKLLGMLKRQWYAEAFICGHQQQWEGYGLVPPNMLIIDSSHSNGTFTLFDLSHEVTMEYLKECTHFIINHQEPEEEPEGYGGYGLVIE